MGVRYCIRGQECTQYAHLGEPTKLRATSESEICEACRHADFCSETPRVAPETLAQPTNEGNEAREEHPKRSDGPKTLSSSAEGRLRQLRRELVLQLYMRRGPLWQAVHDVRNRWNINPKVQLPPPNAGRLLPEDAPDFYDDEYQEYVNRWLSELHVIREQVDPRQYLTLREFLGDGRAESWFEFLEACVLYDPPDDQLTEFASHGDQEPAFLVDDRVSEEALQKRPEMVDPPIKSLWELMQMGDWFWERVLDHVDERYLKPRGIDKEALLQALLLEIPGLLEEYEEKSERYSSRYYIEVNEHTTKEDVNNAFRLIRAGQEERPKGRPQRDRLTAVQCSILHDKHKLTYGELEKRYKLGSVDTAKRYVEEGGTIFEEFSRQKAD